MERRSQLVLVVVVVGVLILGIAGVGVLGNGFFGESQEVPLQENLRITEFNVMKVSCGENILSGVTTAAGNSTGEHQTSFMVIGNVPVPSRSATLKRPKVTNMPTNYIINVTNSGTVVNQGNRECRAKYRMNFTIPHGSTDIHTVTVLHNGQFVMQDYNSRFNNGSIVSGTFVK